MREAWQLLDCSLPSQPVLALRLRRGDLQLAFFSTLTVFSAPLNVTLEELRIESYFPLDDASALRCAELQKAAAAGA